MYTLDDLAAAKQRLAEWNDRFDRYNGNNPNKYRSDIRNAQAEVAMIERALERRGSSD